MREFLLTFVSLSCILITQWANGQSFTTDKNSWIVSGAMSFSKQSGELYEDKEGKPTLLAVLSNSTNYFIVKGLFSGIGINYSYQKTGDYFIKSFGIGPNIGYMYGNKESILYPFVSIGMRFTNSSSNQPPTSYLWSGPLQNFDPYYASESDFSGKSYLGSTGMIIPIRKNIGISLEITYSLNYLSDNKRDYENETKGNILSFSVGIAGLIF